MRRIQENQQNDDVLFNLRNKHLLHGNNNMYLCGPTTYESVHIGNLRTLFFFDLYARIQRYFFRTVKTCVNLTDIDDKIINKAIDSKKSFMETSRYFADQCLQSMSNLGLKFDFTPKVTDFIGEIVQYIKYLKSINIAYEKDGNMLCRIDTNIYNQLKCAGFAKNNEQDFTLWKKSTFPYWLSEFGQGRPGWHLECVVMSLETMQSVEEHFGGCDLIFPHHKNEEYIFHLLNKSPQKWTHFGLLHDEKGQKMSKRLQNTVDISDIEDIDALKIFYLNNNACSNSTFSHDILQSAIKRKQSIEKSLRKCSDEKISSDLKEAFTAHLDDVFKKLNTFDTVAAFTQLCIMMKKFAFERNTYLSILRRVFGLSCF